MSLILKQETSGNVSTPPAGKGTLFLTTSNQVAVKDSAGATSSFVTITSGGNTQILYNDAGAIGGDSSLTFDKTTDLMTVSNLTVTGTLIAGDIAVSSIANGTSNIDIVGVSGNVTTSVAGTANVLVVTSTGANVTGTLNITGNANVGNLGATVIVASTIDGSLTTNAQPNITSVGTLTSLAITGNASAGNFDTLGKVIASTFESNVANGTAPIVVASTTKVANLNADLLDGYNTATTATANTVVIRDTDGSFSANIITATLSGAATTSGTVTTAAQPNITSVGTLTSLTVTGNVSAGNLSTGGILNVTGNANVGNLETTQILAAANITAPQLISNIATGTAPFIVTSTTKVANLNAETVDGYDTDTTATANTIVVRNTDGNISGNYFIGNGSQLTGIDATSIQSGNSNVKVYANANVEISVSGNANIVSVTGTGVNVSGTFNSIGNSNVGNLGTGGLIVATGNVSGGNLTTAGVVVATGNVSGGNLTSSGALSVIGNANVGNIGATAGVFTTVDGTLTTAAQPNITSVGTLTSLSITGNASAGNVYANSGTIGASLLTGTLTTNAQPNITSVGTLTSLSVTGNLSAGNINAGNLLTANFVTGTLTTNTQPNITSTGTLTGLAVDGSNITLSNGVFAGNGSGLFSIAGANVTGTVPNATHSSTANTIVDAAQPNITSVGTLTSLAVTGNASAGNISTSGVLSVTGNANVGNLGATDVVATTLGGSLTTSAQPNITSVGTLTSLAVTGNASAGNISTSGVLSVTGNANVGNLGAESVIATGSGSFTGNVSGGNLTTTGILSVTGTGVSSIAGNLDMTSNNIVNLANPVSAQDAATKAYVDTLVSSGIHYHEPVRVESPTPLNATYNNGTAGVGATLTNAGANAALVIDGISVNVADRVLVYEQADQTTNGVYVVTTVGDGSTAWVLTRASDADTYSPSDAIGLDEGSYFFVQQGVTGAGESYVCSTVGTITFGTTNITFAQFGASQVYSAGTGLTLANLAFSVNASQSQITSVGTLTSLDVSGNITAANITANTGIFAGNGSGLTSLNASNISSGTLAQDRLANSSLTVNGQTISLGGTGTITANTTQTLTFGSYLTGTSFNGGTANTIAVDATTTNTSNKVVARDTNGSFAANIITATLSGAATTAGTVTTAAQPNITSVGTLSSLTLAANGDITLSGTGSNVQGANIVSASYLAGTLTTAAQPNITSVGTLSGLSVAGNVNVTAGTSVQTITDFTFKYFVSDPTSPYFAADTSNATLIAVTTGTTVTLNLSNSTSITVTLTAAFWNDSNNELLWSWNNPPDAPGGGVTLVSIGLLASSASSLTVDSTITGGNLATSGTLSVTGNANVGNLGAVSGIFTTVTGSLITAAQPNITSVGTLTSLAVTGNISAGNVSATTFTGALSGAATTAGTVTTAAQPNITSVGTLTGLVVNGTITGVNITANTGVFTGNGSALAALNASNISSGTLAQSRLANASLTVNGTSIALGGSGTITATATNALTIGTGLGGTSYNGSTGVTITNTGVTSIVAGTNIAVSGATGAVTVSVTGTVPTATTAGTVTTAAQPNITSVGTLTSLTSSGNISGANIIATAYTISSVGISIVAQGTVQANATALTTEFNEVTTVTTGSGVRLPASVAGMRITIINTSANSLLVYPPTSGRINGATNNTAYSQSAGARLDFICTGTASIPGGQWYTMGAVYS